MSNQSTSEEIGSGEAVQTYDAMRPNEPWIAVNNRWFREWNMTSPPDYVEGNSGPYIQDIPLWPIIATPSRLLKDLHPPDDPLWDRVERQCENLSAEEWFEIRRADRREYDALRIERPKGPNSKSGRRFNDRLCGGQFVAIDSEGAVIAHTKTTRKVKGKDRNCRKVRSAHYPMDGGRRGRL